MSAKAIREATGKDIINRHIGANAGAAQSQFASVNESTNWNELIASNPWLETSVSFFFLLNFNFRFFVDKSPKLNCS